MAIIKQQNIGRVASFGSGLSHDRAANRPAQKKLRLTQAKVAELCDITNQYLSNIERATSVPSLETIMRLAAALDTTPDEFLVGAARPEKDEWRSVAEQLRTLSPQQLELVRSFIEWTTQQDALT